MTTIYGMTSTLQTDRWSRNVCLVSINATQKRMQDSLRLRKMDGSAFILREAAAQREPTADTSTGYQTMTTVSKRVITWRMCLEGPGMPASKKTIQELDALIKNVRRFSCKVLRYQQMFQSHPRKWQQNFMEFLAFGERSKTLPFLKKGSEMEAELILSSSIGTMLSLQERLWPIKWTCLRGKKSLYYSDGQVKALAILLSWLMQKKQLSK